jgi:hypothetical protein
MQSCTHSGDELEALNEGDAAVVAGVITEIKVLTTKKGRNPGQQMGKFSLRFGIDTFSVTMFPNVWKDHVNLGTYMPGPEGVHARAGQPCSVSVRSTNGPQQIRFGDNAEILATDEEFVPLLAKGQKVIIRGKRDDRSQIIAQGVMEVAHFLASQLEPAAE